MERRGRAHFHALGIDRGSVVCGLVYWGKRTAARLKAVGWAAEACEGKGVVSIKLYRPLKSSHRWEGLRLLHIDGIYLPILCLTALLLPLSITRLERHEAAGSNLTFSAAISAWLTAPHPSSEAKQVRAGVALRWGTTREGPVLRFFFYFLSTFLSFWNAFLLFRVLR